MVTHLRPFLILSLLISAPLYANEDRLAHYHALARQGGPHLALQLLTQQRPAPDQQPDVWLQWERQRLELMREQQWWYELEHATLNIAPWVPVEFTAWVQRLRIETLIHLHRGEEARALIVQQLWEVTPDRLATTHHQWLRQQIIQSYIADSAGGDAYIALRRLQADYGNPTNDRDEVIPQTLVLLGSDYPEAALTLLQQLVGEDDELQLLKDLAQIRIGQQARSIMVATQQRLNDAALTPEARKMSWGVIAEAADQLGNRPLYVIALEGYYRIKQGYPSDSGLFRFTPEQLWQGYQDYAHYVANQAQFLVGDDASWLADAETSQLMYPIRSRSLLSYLRFNAADPATRGEAERRLITLLQQGDGGGTLIEQLYLNSESIDASQLPEQVAQLLLDMALQEGRLERASTLVAQIKEPPEGVERFIWQLRHAKIHLLAANSEAAVALLKGLIDEINTVSSTQRDRYIQLIFDLQSADAHEAAYQLLSGLYQRLPEPPLRRELLFWMADSKLALDAYAEAASLYMESAMLPGAQTMDPWAQTARYHAAKALVLARIYPDAREIYQQLLRVTEQPARQRVIERELSKIPNTPL